MYLTNLATIARQGGLAVVEQPGWKTRGHGGMTDVRAIVCHHTAGGAGNTASLGVVQNGRSDLPGPLSHFLLAKDGTAYVVAAGLCYHAGAVLNASWGNAYAIGIEAERSVADINARTPWPEPQLRAYAKLCRALQNAYGGVPVLGHKEVCAPRGRKIDPDFDMAAFRGRVAAATPEDDMAFTQDDFNDLMWTYRFDDDGKGHTGNFAQAIKGIRDTVNATAAAVAKGSSATAADIAAALLPGLQDAVREQLVDVEGLDEQAVADRLANDLANRLAQ